VRWGRASLRADSHVLRGDDAGALPSAGRAPRGEQDTHVDATVVLLGINGGDVYAFVANCTQCPGNRVGKRRKTNYMMTLPPTHR